MLSTWHDNIREAQLSGDGHASREEDHVFPPQLFDVTVKQLKRHRQAWNPPHRHKINYQIKNHLITNDYSQTGLYSMD